MPILQLLLSLSRISSIFFLSMKRTVKGQRRGWTKLRKPVTFLQAIDQVDHTPPLLFPGELLVILDLAYPAYIQLIQHCKAELNNIIHQLPFFLVTRERSI
jgi:hypothetical protein